MTTTDERLWREYDRTAARLKTAPQTNRGGVAAEVQFGQAYRALVRAGLAPKLRAKYQRKVTGR